MNIWIFNHYAFPPDLPGSTRHCDLARELVKRGHKVTIFATSFHHYLHREARLKPGEHWKTEDIDGVKFVWIRTPPYQRNDQRRVMNMVAFMLRTWRLGQKLPEIMPKIGRPDVIIGSSPHLLTPLSACWVARHFKVPFVMEVRDLWPQVFVDLGEFSEEHPVVIVLRALERLLYRNARLIIILGSQMREYISAKSIDSKKLVWVPNGVDLSRFDRISVPEISTEGFRLMYLGAHGQSNGLDVLIEAAKIVQDKGLHEIRFVLIGDGPEKPRLIEQAKILGLSNVEFLDPLPKLDVPKILNEASATVITYMPSFVTSGGSLNKMFDYMAASKPVIFSGEATYNPVEETSCGLNVPPRDPGALAKAIIKLYTMTLREREDMGRRGLDYVKEHHDISRLAGLLEHTLTQIL